jgi:uncharacterized glyoxalase superfamily protein PhnB
LAKLTRVAPELPTASLQNALAYFEQNLGFRVAMQIPDRGYAIIERDDIAIHLFQDGSEKHSPVGLHIFTSDLEALYAEFQQSGAHLSQAIVRKPWGNRDFRVRDDFGDELKFTEPLADE